MAGDILNMYGSDSSQPQAAPASNGGKCDPKPIPYSPPVGPKNKTDIGKNGVNHGVCGTQGRY